MPFSITPTTVSTLAGGIVIIGYIIRRLVQPYLKMKKRAEIIRSCKQKIGVARAILRTSDLVELRRAGGLLVTVKKLVTENGLKPRELGIKADAIVKLEASLKQRLATCEPTTMASPPQANPGASSNHQEILDALQRRKRRTNRDSAAPRPETTDYPPLLRYGTGIGGPVRECTLEFPTHQGAENAASSSRSSTQPSIVPPPGSDRHAPPDIGGAGSERRTEHRAGLTANAFVREANEPDHLDLKSSSGVVSRRDLHHHDAAVPAHDAHRNPFDGDDDLSPEIERLSTGTFGQ